MLPRTINQFSDEASTGATEDGLSLSLALRPGRAWVDSAINKSYSVLEQAVACGGHQRLVGQRSRFGRAWAPWDTSTTWFRFRLYGLHVLCMISKYLVAVSIAVEGQTVRPLAEADIHETCALLFVDCVVVMVLASQGNLMNADSVVALARLKPSGATCFGAKKWLDLPGPALPGAAGTFRRGVGRAAALI